MTVELTDTAQALLDEALKSGQFESAEQLIEYSLSRTLADQAIPSDAAFVEQVKTALAQAKEDIDAGRIKRFTKETHHELYDDILERGRKKLAEHKNT